MANEDDEDKLISAAQRAIAVRRWKKAGLRKRLMQGQILKMARLRAMGFLVCTDCGKAVKRDSEGKYIHADKRIKDHSATTT